MLDAQIFVDLLLKFAVRMNLHRHGDFLSEGSSQKAWTRPVRFRIFSKGIWRQKAVHFHDSKYRLPSRCRYCACEGFSNATREMIRNPSFEVERRGRLRQRSAACLAIAFDRDHRRRLSPPYLGQLRYRQSLLDSTEWDRERTENNRERYCRIKGEANAARVGDLHFSENL
jgi:hypothetical protein